MNNGPINSNNEGILKRIFKSFFNGSKCENAELRTNVNNNEMHILSSNGNAKVILLDAGTNIIGVIKIVREATGLLLKDAKELVDKVPCAIIYNISLEDAELLKSELEAIGAIVDIVE